MFVLVA